MESLIPVISKLQDVFATIGYRESEVQLPQIVVVGSQSAGKSSVIEGIVGRDFLPRGVGIVTRRPLLLHLIHIALDDPQRHKYPGIADKDYAIFEHKPDEIFTDFESVRLEIEDDTNRLTGTNKGISPTPINLKIYSHRVVNLSLIDLPGITKVPVGDQPLDIEMQTRKMILSYIKNPNSIILAVTPANQDFATSEPLKLAREVDKEGDRTLAVLTKLDLMDHGTDAMDVLTGKLVPVKLGIIGIVNRSQADIVAKKSVQDCLKDEMKFLHKKYPTLASVNGIQYLSKTLNRMLIAHIRECLPQLKLRVSTMTAQCLTLLHSYGEPVTDKSRTLLQIITDFSTAYTSTIEGTSKNIETNELSGGARIHYIFHETFGKTLEKVDPMDNLSPWDILTAIRNATGPRTALFVPDISFELLVKRQIRRLEEPGLNCVDLVYEELLRIVQHCGFEIEQEIQRFPRLFERINEVLSAVLCNRLAPTKEFVSNLVNIELAYINSKHPEFADTALLSILKDSAQSMEGGISAGTSMNEGINEIAPADEMQSRIKSKGGGNTRKKTAQAITNGIAPTAEFSESSANLNGKSDGKANGGSMLGYLMPFGRSGKSTNNTEAETAEAAKLRTGHDRTMMRSLNAKEKQDCQTIERLIRGYFMIVRKTIQDLVPKAIMNFLVNNVRDNLQSELVRQLYNAPDLDELLNESGEMANRRKETAEMLEALKKANSVISEIRETHIW